MNGKQVRTGVCIYACNMEIMVRFYRDTLGFSTDWDGGGFAEFVTAGGKLSFFMYDRKEFTKAINEKYIPADGINQTFEIALWLPRYSDVDDEYERLRKLGVSLPMGAPITFTFGIRNFYVADPEGNLLEIGSMTE